MHLLCFSFGAVFLFAVNVLAVRRSLVAINYSVSEFCGGPKVCRHNCHTLVLTSAARRFNLIDDSIKAEPNQYSSRVIQEKFIGEKG